MTNAVVRAIAVTTHGRYLVMAPAETPAGLIVGFHGYAENAEIHLEALRAIPGIDRFVVVAVQALHPFYTREQRVVASWMTRQDRDFAIADNLAYVETASSRLCDASTAWTAPSSSSASRRAAPWLIAPPRVSAPTD